MKLNKINLDTTSLEDLSVTELRNITGGSSAFTDIGYWFGRATEAVVNFITTPSGSGQVQRPALLTEAYIRNPYH